MFLDKEEFDVLKAVRHFDSVEDLDACFRIDVVDLLSKLQTFKELSNDHLETCLHLSSDMQDDDKELKAQVQYLEGRGFVRRERFEPLDRPLKEEKPASPSKPELAPLPSHLKYLFLDKEETLPIIVWSDLTKNEEERIIELLWKYPKVLAQSLGDIRGINPAFCTHKILMEPEHKPTVQPQRRLNPNMKEVVKAEVIKLLDAGIIYAISDSTWVSPIQVVPKKGGMTVVTN